MVNGETKRCGDLGAGLGHDRVEHDSHFCQNSSDESVECHCLFLFAFFHECPRLILVDGFVGNGQRTPQLFKIAVYLHLKEQRFEFFQ